MTDLALFLIGIAAAAMLADGIFPATGRRGWDDSRAATQRDVAEVLRGHRKQPSPNTTGLVLFGLAAWVLYVVIFAD